LCVGTACVHTWPLMAHDSASAHPHQASIHLLPVRPSKIVGIGRNYRDHAKELGNDVPTTPLYFLKAPSSLLHDGGTVLLPPESQRVDFEGELGIVIAKAARRVKVEEALDYVAGYVAACDVTARDLQNSDGQWSRAKGFDTFCPVSSKVVTGVDPTALALTTTVNGVVRQSSNTSELVFGVAEIVAHVSAAMTLLPGDLILTGTPAGVGPLAPGDHVEVTIAAVGTVSFDVAAEQT
jgi:2-keto-4-pentenoate hydratase/2-oxohepta-3-ene-1,7-dioic acid hydratase in catechol pathway